MPGAEWGSPGLGRLCQELPTDGIISGDARFELGDFPNQETPRAGLSTSLLRLLRQCRACRLQGGAGSVSRRFGSLSSMMSQGTKFRRAAIEVLRLLHQRLPGWWRSSAFYTRSCLAGGGIAPSTPGVSWLMEALRLLHQGLLTDVMHIRYQGMESSLWIPGQYTIFIIPLRPGTANLAYLSAGSAIPRRPLLAFTFISMRCEQFSALRPAACSRALGYWFAVPPLGAVCALSIICFHSTQGCLVAALVLTAVPLQALTTLVLILLPLDAIVTISMKHPHWGMIHYMLK